MLAEMGGKTFSPESIPMRQPSTSVSNPTVTLDAQDNPDAVFIFNVGTTLTTCALSGNYQRCQPGQCLLILGTALGADSRLVGNVSPELPLPLEPAAGSRVAPLLRLP
jgi:hypothetical protein